MSRTRCHFTAPTRTRRGLEIPSFYRASASSRKPKLCSRHSGVRTLGVQSTSPPQPRRCPLPEIALPPPRNAHLPCDSYFCLHKQCSCHSYVHILGWDPCSRDSTVRPLNWPSFSCHSLLCDSPPGARLGLLRIVPVTEKNAVGPLAESVLKKPHSRKLALNDKPYKA